jgi:hypothetical protein
MDSTRYGSRARRRTTDQTRDPAIEARITWTPKVVGANNPNCSDAPALRVIEATARQSRSASTYANSAARMIEVAVGRGMPEAGTTGSAAALESFRLLIAAAAVISLRLVKIMGVSDMTLIRPGGRHQPIRTTGSGAKSGSPTALSNRRPPRRRTTSWMAGS